MPIQFLESDRTSNYLFHYSQNFVPKNHGAFTHHNFCFTVFGFAFILGWKKKQVIK